MDIGAADADMGCFCRYRTREGHETSCLPSRSALEMTAAGEVRNVPDDGAGGLKLLHVSNLLELFGASTQSVSDLNLLVPMRQAYKASQWAEPEGPAYALLAQDAPQVPERFRSVWKSPERVFTAGDAPEQALGVTPALVDEVLNWIGPARTLRIVATAQSEALQRLIAAIRKSRPHLAVDGLPRMPVGAVRRLNTKTGGRQFLREAGIPERELTPQTLFPTLDAALRWLAGVPPGSSFMLKANAALGGFGVIPFRSGSPVSERALEVLRGRRRHATSWKAIGTIDDGVVLEAMVGTFETNWSITADFECSPAGVVCLGMGDQILMGGVGYRGFRSGPKQGWRRSESRIGEIGQRVGDALVARGYAGPFNIDVVVPRAEPARCYLIEINVRRSAPLGGFLILRRLFGTAWRDNMHVLMTEDMAFTGRTPRLETFLNSLDRSSLCYDPATREGVLPFLADPVGRRFAGLIVSSDEDGVKRLSAKLGAVLHHG